MVCSKWIRHLISDGRDSDGENGIRPEWSNKGSTSNGATIGKTGSCKIRISFQLDEDPERVGEIIVSVFGAVVEHDLKERIGSASGTVKVWELNDIR